MSTCLMSTCTSYSDSVSDSDWSADAPLRRDGNISSPSSLVSSGGHVDRVEGPSAGGDGIGGISSLGVGIVKERKCEHRVGSQSNQG